MLTQQQNSVLTGVSPGTPLHEPLSRYWYPMLRSEDLADRCVRKARLLGMNFVIARRGAELLAMDEQCPHRGASLSLARVEDNGLRCIYHGWVVSGEGKVVEAPNEREEGGRERVCVRAPKVREVGGLIWMNICESEAERAPFPDLAWMRLPAEQYVIVDALSPFNWVQSLEGAIDSSHSSFLHSDEIISVTSTDASLTIGTGKTFRFARPSTDKHPRIKVRDTECGFIYGALRKPIRDPESTVYIRASAYAYPSYVAFPSSDTYGDIQIFVPIDETHSHFFYIRYSTRDAVDKEALTAWSGLEKGKDIDDRNYIRASSMPSWGQDRAAMAKGESFTGFRGVNLQDLIIQESMGPIIDRTKENLGAADLAIATFRRKLLLAAEGKGSATPGFANNLDYRSLVARDGLFPAEEDWTGLFKEQEVNWSEAE